MIERNEILKIERFQFATSLYLNMENYHIRLTKGLCNIFTGVLSCSNCKFKQIAIKARNPPDISNKNEQNIPGI